MIVTRVVFEAEASGGEVRQVVSPPFPFPFPFPLSFQTNKWEGRSDPVRGKFPGFPSPYKYHPGCDKLSYPLKRRNGSNYVTVRLNDISTSK